MRILVSCLYDSGGERDGRKLPALQPVHRRGVDGHGLFGADIWPVFQVVVLPFLLGLEVQPGQAPEVLASDRLVDRRAPPDALPVVVGHVRPPVGLHLDIPQDHRLDRRGESRNLPGDVGLPATPRLAQVLQDGLGLVLLDALWHHVQDVMHDGRTKLEIEVTLDPLLGDRLGHALVLAALELPREQVAEPPLQQRHDAAQEEQPHPPHRRPEPDTRTLADGTRVEPVVDEVLEVLAHPHLSHQLVLVAVHAGELTHVRERVLQSVSQLEGVNVAQPVLDVGVDDQLGQTEDLTAEVEGVSKAALLPLLGRQRLDRLQVEVVVQVQVVQMLPVDKQVEHVVSLAADLQAGLDPVQLGVLEELGRGQALEERPLLHRLLGPLVQLVLDPVLEQLLVRHPHLDRLARGAVLLEPLGDERHVDGTLGVSRARVERRGRP